MNQRVCSPRMYATPENPDRCPVQLVMFYEAQRSGDYFNDSAPFYIAVVDFTWSHW